MSVIFLDAQTDTSVTPVDMVIPPQDSLSSGIMPGRFAVTPDSRYTIVASAGGAWGFGMIDNVQHKAVDVNIYEMQSISFWIAASQKIPK